MTTPARSDTPAGVGGADLLHAQSLFVDGPVLWGHPVPSNKPGVFVVELAAPQATVSIDPSAVRGWLERVPDLRLDGKQPTVGELQARLAGFWLPGQTVLYVGSSQKSIGARLNGMYKTPLGDRRPQPAGHWLKTLHDLTKARIWWAETDDAELYEDAILDAFAGAAGGALPFAVLSTPSGKRKEHGLAASLRDVEEFQPAPKRSPAEARSRELASSRAARLGLPVSAVGGSEPDPEAARRAAARAPRPAASPKPAAATAARSTASRSTAPRSTGSRAAGSRAAAARAEAAQPPAAPSQYVSSAGLEQVQAELERLTSVDRPQVIARIKAARELGDLSENADYEAARKEQSFLEGRVQQLEQLLKQAVVIDESQLGHHVSMGSTVVVESDRHGQETFTLVGSIEADASSGKISYTSPIGKALMGKRAGDTVRVEVPAGAMVFTVVEVR